MACIAGVAPPTMSAAARVALAGFAVQSYALIFACLHASLLDRVDWVYALRPLLNSGSEIKMTGSCCWLGGFHDNKTG